MRRSRASEKAAAGKVLTRLSNPAVIPAKAGIQKRYGVNAPKGGKVRINIRVNDSEAELDVPPWRTLLEALREDLDLTGTKSYCHSGVCGACTVLLDGAPVSSCSLLAVQVDGREITTVEGLTHSFAGAEAFEARNVGGPPEGTVHPSTGLGRTDLHPIQQAFIDHFGFQCGYCTPGMLLLTKALLDENPRPTREEIIRYMGGNICRCTGYAGILASVEAAAEAMAREKVTG